ncbi:class II aldolase/adducin family protein [Rhodococcus qingshengii]|uniref:class II aldolase/adducin family protein n=1 Tax=Rhodococcus qingshengii TaxID=334542 RepID=UPI001C8BB0D8|nr:class II aldolase/adducin family protein [Rhodococcus qingshengii]MBX9152099.1 aldolase [Rhodococcus qingshengii]
MTDLRAQLVAAGAQLSALGLSPGASGNLSVRSASTMIVTPTGVPLSDLDTHMLSEIDLETSQVLSGPAPTKEFPLHRAMYERSPAVGAIVHLHSPYATAWSCRPSENPASAIPAITPYFVMKVGRTPLIDYAPPGDPRMADVITRPPFTFEAALLQNHGPVVAKSTMSQAVAAAIELEETCRILTILGSGPIHPLNDCQIEELRERYEICW